ncbi:MAG: hypothetical protein CME88_02585 [Hirschia sp.]|nr:hypothetical protein [Hirschia sp.]MBF17250.1 hypothetical protein [Hirschia sp.]
MLSPALVLALRRRGACADPVQLSSGSGQGAAPTDLHPKKGPVQVIRGVNRRNFGQGLASGEDPRRPPVGTVKEERVFQLFIQSPVLRQTV